MRHAKTMEVVEMGLCCGAAVIQSFYNYEESKWGPVVNHEFTEETFKAALAEAEQDCICDGRALVYAILSAHQDRLYGKWMTQAGWELIQNYTGGVVNPNTDNLLFTYTKVLDVSKEDDDYDYYD